MIEKGVLGIHLSPRPCISAGEREEEEEGLDYGYRKERERQIKKISPFL